MPTTTRRTHKKSRHGCQQCKRNRIKCDEIRPSCGRCSRIGYNCSLMDPTSALIIISGLPSASQYTPSNRVTVPLSPVSLTSSSDVNTTAAETETEPEPINLVVSDAERQRMRLVNHYNQYAALSISKLTLDTEQGKTIWLHAVPELALKNDFLLHGLLSISALHLALTSQSEQQDNMVLAVEHHNHGISLFTPHLDNLDLANIDALFTFACFTALYSFGIHLANRSRSTPLKRIHEVFTMVRGTCVFVHSGLEQLVQGMWGAWFSTMLKPDYHDLPALKGDVFDRLTARIQSTITTSSQSKMYLEAIHALKQNLITATMLTRSQKSIVLFPIMAPPGFVEMICLAEPLALAILANWAVILHWYRNHIWAQDWGRQTIKAVQEVLPVDWHDCIAWALDELEVTEDRLFASSSITAKPPPWLSHGGDGQSPALYLEYSTPSGEKIL